MSFQHGRGDRGPLRPTSSSSSSLSPSPTGSPIKRPQSISNAVPLNHRRRSQRREREGSGGSLSVSVVNMKRPGFGGRGGKTRPFSIKAEAEIDKRQSFSLQGALRPVREGKIFSCFMVVGLLPHGIDSKESRIYHPSILFSYPPNADSSAFDSLPEFCFPHGVETRVIRRTPSASEENGILFASLNDLQDANRSFIILLTGSSSLLYGVCVVDNEFVDLMPSFMQQPPPWKNNRTRVVAPRCYVLISRFPFFRLHFDVLYSLLASERLFRMTMDGGGKQSTALRILATYGITKVPKKSETLQLQLPNEVQPLRFNCPPGSEDQLLVEFCTGCAFRLVPPTVLLLLLQSLFMEESVVLISTNLSVLSAVTLTFIPALRPLTWQGLLIPILPFPLHECLHAPVPYIIGVEFLPQSTLRELTDEGTHIYNVDKNEWVSEPPKPQLPGFNHLLKQVTNPSFQPNDPDKRKSCLAQPYRNSAQQLGESSKIIKAIVDYNNRFFVNSFKIHVPKCSIPISKFDIAVEDHLSMLLTHYDERYQSFLRRLFSSQMYVFYFDQILLPLLNANSQWQIPNTERQMQGHKSLSSIQETEG